MVYFKRRKKMISFERECPDCGSRFLLPNQDEPIVRVMAGVDRIVNKNNKSYLYCWPCYQKKTDEFKKANPNFKCH